MARGSRALTKPLGVWRMADVQMLVVDVSAAIPDSVLRGVRAAVESCRSPNRRQPVRQRLRERSRELEADHRAAVRGGGCGHRPAVPGDHVGHNR